jgi:hypothetical protein
VTPPSELHRVAAGETASDLEPGDEADEAGEGVVGVPVSGDLARIVDRQDRVENRLIRQARRPGHPAAASDKLQLGNAGGSIEDHGASATAIASWNA